MIASGYTMNLYCEFQTDLSVHSYMDELTYKSIGEFVGETYAQCAKQAKKAGWFLTSDRQRCYCPSCAKIGKMIERKKLDNE